MMIKTIAPVIACVTQLKQKNQDAILGEKPSQIKTKRGSGFKPVAIYLTSPSKKIGAKRGFSDQFLLTHWKEIVGAELGEITRPREMNRSRNRGAVLVVECVAAYVSELTMRAEEMRMKINSSMGHEAISKIQFAHQAIGFDEPKSQFIPRDHVIKPIPADLKINIEKPSSTALKDALSNITNAYFKVKDTK